MTRIFNFPILTQNPHYQNAANEFCETVKKNLEKSPVAKFALGILPVPVVIGLELAVGKAFELAGHDTFAYEHSKRHYILNVSLLSKTTWISCANNITSIADPIFYSEFIQNYLLDDRLSALLKKISPDHVDFLQTTKGKICRILATSLVAFGISFGYSGFNYPLANTLAISVNRFILVAFFGGLREITNSNLTGIGLNCFKNL